MAGQIEIQPPAHAPGLLAGKTVTTHWNDGAALALNVAKRLVVHMQRRGRQSQFSPYLSPCASDTWQALLIWLL
ncbi:hypothetical protein CPter91_0277 [Collimonas pratensis]|uniref:Uncharacterized protein n=1 Tax=Collimonas pratensis TaxID=279113 RepID=A0A127PY31_9BURK|nr:hypothetical protein CPter91_0277 [Collimonas pratensis]